VNAAYLNTEFSEFRYGYKDDEILKSELSIMVTYSNMVSISTDLKSSKLLPY